MSRVGHINSVKMTILSKFLYLFQAVPLFHTLSQVFNIKLEPNPLTALFGAMEGEKKLTIAKQHTLSVASPLAR